MRSAGLEQLSRQVLIFERVNVHLDSQHICDGGVAARFEQLENARRAPGRGPVMRDEVGVMVGYHAAVRGGDDAAGRVIGMRQALERDVAYPFVVVGVARDGRRSLAPLSN